MVASVKSYIHDLAELAAATEVTRASGENATLDVAAGEIARLAQGSYTANGRVWFVGNGGSAAIASHMANDFTRNGGFRAATVGDSAVITCLANDFGYPQVYAKALELQACAHDGLIAISSSGNSPNILNAVEAARQIGLWVVTLSGFSPENRLRSLGDWNLYLRSQNYGSVEVGHLMLLHAVLDLSMGWPDIGRRSS